LAEQNTLSIKPWNIIALTRDSSSAQSQRLAKLQGVKVVQAGPKLMDEPAETMSSIVIPEGSVHGVFSVQGYVSDEIMVKQGKSESPMSYSNVGYQLLMEIIGCAIADAAHAYGVKHFVYSSTDIGELPRGKGPP